MTRNLNTVDSFKVEESIRKKWLFYPDQRIKIYWDLYIFVILIISVVQTPIDIAFFEPSNYWTFNDGLNVFVDVMFGIDIIVNFFSAYEVQDILSDEVVDDRKLIAKNYLTGWFIIDLLAILPISHFFEGMKSGNYNELVRIVRLGKLSKMLKLLKLLRLIKFLKNKNKITNQINSMVEINIGVERISMFAISFLMLSHIVACLWVICAKFIEDETDADQNITWIQRYGVADEKEYGSAYVYFVSLYYTVTTITTVGYGDISAYNNIERGFAILLMLIGVTCFSYLNGALASVFQSMDEANAEMNQRIDLTNKIIKRYSLPKGIKQKIIHDLERENSNNDYQEVRVFLDFLAPKLRYEVTLMIY